MSNLSETALETLGKIPSGLFILTGQSEDVRIGLLLSWVQQCGFEPPAIMLAINKEREVAKVMDPGFPFVLNILSESSANLIAHFGKGFGPDENPFAGLDVDASNKAGVILSEAHSYLVAKVSHRFQVSDHDIIVANLEEGKVLQQGKPAVHIRKRGSHY